MLRRQRQQLDVEFGGLAGQEPDPGGDRAQGAEGDSVLDGGGGGTGQAVDPVELPGQSETSELGSEVFGATTIKLFSSLIALVRLTRTPCRVASTCRIASRTPRSRG